MTQKENDLLLKDLSARLPYRVKCHFKYGSAEGDVTLGCIDNNVIRFEYGWYGRFHVSIDADYIKPYLFPLSSMTEKQKKEYQYITEKLRNHPTYSISDSIDWLNANHFDFRGLIPIGLAIDATKLNIY